MALYNTPDNDWHTWTHIVSANVNNHVKYDRATQTAASGTIGSKRSAVRDNTHMQVQCVHAAHEYAIFLSTS